MISERTSQQQELRRQLAQTEQELCELRRDKERDEGGEADHLRRLLKEKETFIKVSSLTLFFFFAFPPALSSRC